MDLEPDLPPWPDADLKGALWFAGIPVLVAGGVCAALYACGVWP